MLESCRLRSLHCSEIFVDVRWLAVPVSGGNRTTSIINFLCSEYVVALLVGIFACDSFNYLCKNLTFYRSFAYEIP